MNTSILGLISCLFILNSTINPTFAQTVSCENLMRAVEAEADFYQEISSISLILTSDFLEEVKSYEYEGTLFVIAKFKREPMEIFSKRYVFCDVPKSNWNSFANGWNGSYGERFHEFIIKYVCNCSK